MINPKYITQAAQGKIFLEDIDISEKRVDYYSYEAKKHLEYLMTLPAPQDLALWPLFSLERISFKPGENLHRHLAASASALTEFALGEYEIEMFRKEYNCANAKELAKTIYELLAKKQISLASPFFKNIRLKNPGNLASCFVLEVNDSLRSIMKSLDYAARISKAGGGSGIYLGNLRAAGQDVGGKGKAQSVVYWAKLFDSVCLAVNQLGARPGAMTITLPVWHADIYDFLELQAENGDPRTKCYNVQPQVSLSAHFLKAVKDNTDFQLFSNSNENCLVPVRTVKARHLWGKIQEAQRMVGRPYFFFSDNANADSPFKENFGEIKSANLCCESFSYFEADEYIHTCNLISVNPAECETYDDIRFASKWAAVLADITHHPRFNHLGIPEVLNHSRDFRTIGIGLIGYADWLAKKDKFYGDTEEASKVAKTIAEGAYFSNLKMAQYAGACKQWQNLNDTKLWEKLDPEGLRFEYGLRNAYMLAYAPNTSTSLTMGATAAFLPPYDLDFYEENNDSTTHVVVKYLPDKYLTVDVISPDFIIETTAAMQEWVDAGMSMEWMLRAGKASSDNKSLSNYKFKAHELGCKTVYYLRSKTKAVKSDCAVCNN